MWSPQSQRKWYQLRIWYSVSLQLGLALVGPDGPSVPVDAARGDLADRPVVDPLHALEVAGLVAALGAGDDGQLLALGLLVGGQHLADAGAVDADGLLGEEVLAGLDGRLDVQGPEARRRRQHHQVAAVDHLLVGVEADEAAVVGDVELVLAVLGVPNRSRQFRRRSWNTSARAWSLML